jgi:HK97 family phage prohead protease
MNDNKQYKDLQTTIKDVDEKGRVLVAANAIGNEDSDNDISEPGSFHKTLSENFHRLKWFLNHNPDYLVGVPIEGKEKNPYLELLGQINLKKQLGRDVYEDYKLYAEFKKSLEHSIGVNAIKKEQKGERRHVYEWKLWEYSTLYSWGANENTPLIAMKSHKSIEDEIDWLEIKLRKGNFSDEKFLNIEKQISQLRSLCLEPDISTYKAEPNLIEVEPEQKIVTTLPDTAHCPGCLKYTKNTQEAKGYIRCHRCETVFTYGGALSLKLT